MAELSLLEMPKLKQLVRQYGYAVHVHDACGGQSFTLEQVDENPSERVYEAIKEFFAERGMSMDFYDEKKLNFAAR